ncbi:hypothetical protein GOP47_0029878 [Adiantum capillus-veneris]|nr:hypothetical protein GOP47_0029878 [Adiantum capillus-veneris]
MNHLILSSNLYIEVPLSQDPGPHLRRYLIDDSESLSALRPLELTPFYVIGLYWETDDNVPLEVLPVDYYGSQSSLYLLLPTPQFL